MKLGKVKFLLLLFILVIGKSSLSQDNKVIFGVQYRPIVPNEAINNEILELESNILSATIENKIGHSFGFLIRRNFTDRWSLETGISIINRNFEIDAIHDSTERTAVFPLRMQTYEIPVEALYYVRLSDKVYMNSLAGFSANIFPTQLAKVSDNLAFSAKSARRSWFGLSLLANVGFEFRSDDSGYFYLGASIHRPLLNVSQFQVDYRPDNTSLEGDVAVERFEGNFFSIDFKYFFKADDDKKDKKR